MKRNTKSPTPGWGPKIRKEYKKIQKIGLFCIFSDLFRIFGAQPAVGDFVFFKNFRISGIQGFLGFVAGPQARNTIYKLKPVLLSPLPRGCTGGNSGCCHWAAATGGGGGGGGEMGSASLALHADEGASRNKDRRAKSTLEDAQTTPEPRCKEMSGLPTKHMSMTRRPLWDI